MPDIQCEITRHKEKKENQQKQSINKKNDYILILLEVPNMRFDSSLGPPGLTIH